MLFGSITSDVTFKESTDGEPSVCFDLLVSRPSRTDGLPSGEDTIPIINRYTQEKIMINYPQWLNTENFLQRNYL